MGIALALRKANLLAEIMAYHKSAVCRSASPAFSFVLVNIEYSLCSRAKRV